MALSTKWRYVDCTVNTLLLSQRRIVVSSMLVIDFTSPSVSLNWFIFRPLHVIYRFYLFWYQKLSTVSSLSFVNKKRVGNMILHGVCQHHQLCQKATLSPLPSLKDRLGHNISLDTETLFQNLKVVDEFLGLACQVPWSGPYLEANNFAIVPYGFVISLHHQ